MSGADPVSADPVSGADPSGRSERIVRVIDLETTGSRPDAAVIEIGWQDVAIGPDGSARLLGGPRAVLVDPGVPITPNTSAIHHIVDEDVQGAPRFLDVAPDILRPGGVVALAAHRSSFERSFCSDALTGGLPWVCTHKASLRVWPEAPTHSNQGLRYWRRPEGLDRATGLPAHRAGPDAYVTAHHLVGMLATHPLDALLTFSQEPTLLARVPYGPDRGERFTTLSRERLEHLVGRGGDVAHASRHTLALLDAAEAGAVQAGAAGAGEAGPDGLRAAEPDATTAPRPAPAADLFG